MNYERVAMMEMIDNDDWYAEMVDIQMKIELSKVMKNLIRKTY